MARLGRKGERFRASADAQRPLARLIDALPQDEHEAIAKANRLHFYGSPLAPSSLSPAAVEVAAAAAEK